MEKGVPINLCAGDGLTTMHWALAQDDVKIFGFLLNHDADVDMRSGQGATALMNAVRAMVWNGMDKATFLLYSTLQILILWICEDTQPFIEPQKWVNLILLSYS